MTDRGCGRLQFLVVKHGRLWMWKIAIPGGQILQTGNLADCNSWWSNKTDYGCGRLQFLVVKYDRQTGDVVGCNDYHSNMSDLGYGGSELLVFKQDRRGMCH